MSVIAGKLYHDVIAGKLYHEDGSYDLALADTDGQNETGNYKTVVRFPEGEGGKEVEHNVPHGTGGGQFSQS